LRWPETVVGTLWALGAPFLLLLPVNHDSAWLMWLARQMLHGIKLYSDLVEVNPPLWFWMAVPLQWISECMGVEPTRVLVGLFVVSIGLTLWLSSSIIRDWPTAQRVKFYVGLVLAVVALPLLPFTQREHFALVVTIPYVLLVGSEQRPSSGIAVIVGLLAALGFALKPFFVLVFLCLELWRWAGPKIEAYTVVCVLAIYAAAIPIFAPAYLSAMVPIAVEAYGYFGAMVPERLAYGLVPILLCAPLIGRSGAPAQALLVAALSFYLGVLAQNKGWGYHLIPTFGFLTLAVAITARRFAWREVLAVIGILIAIVPNLSVYRNDQPIARHITAPRGSTVAILGFSSKVQWPLVENRGYIWPLRFMTLWTIPAIHAGEPLLDRTRHDVFQDLACNPPRQLVVEADAVPLFSDLLGYFRLVDVVGNYRIYEPARPLPKIPRCRHIY